MVSVHLGPTWFFGVDAGLEALTAVVAFCVVVAALRVFQFTREKKYGYFTLAFGLLTLSFLSRAVADLLIEELLWKLPQELIAKIFLFGYVSHIFFAIAAYLILLVLTYKIEDARVVTLIGLLLIPALLLSGSYFLSFYIISALMLGYIALAYYHNFKRVCSMPSCLVFWAFVFLFLAQVLFLCEIVHDYWYAAAHIVQACGYLLMLIALLRITFTNHEKK